MQDETDGRSRPQPVHQRYGGQTAERGCRETGGHVGHDSIRSLITQRQYGKQTLGKNTEVNQEIEKFTVGRDRELDLYLARYDVLGSMAHITMLESIGLLGKDEQPVLLEELRRIHADIEAGRFIIEEGVEDVHSQVELLLTRKLGDVGKKDS